MLKQKLFFWGGFAFSITAVNDLLVVNGLLETPRLTPLGFLAIVLSMALSLARRFTYSYSELETTVQYRTEQLEQKNKELDAMAHIDPLTKTYNRRFFDDTILQKIAQHEQNQTPFWIALCDVDNFKNINDTYGHGFGDLVLASLSDAMKTQLKTEDFLARWGGEEFIIILNNEYLDNCEKVLERVRSSIEALEFQTKSEAAKITITIGTAQYNGNKQLKEVIKDSDEALYHGKRNGKNQVVVANSL